MHVTELNFNVHAVLHCVQVAITLPKEYKNIQLFCIFNYG